MDFGEERQGASGYLQALRDHWVLILLLVAGAVGAATAYSLLASKQYEAEADVLVTPISSSDDTYVGIPSLLRETEQGRAVLTASRLMRSPAVAQGVADRLGGDWSRRRLLDQTEVTPVGQSSVVSIKATTDDPELSATVANAFAEELIAQRTKLFEAQLTTVIQQLRQELAVIPETQQSIGQGLAIASRLGSLTPLVGQPDPTLQVSSRAVPPETASWPRPALSIAVALVASLLLGTGLAVGLELITPRVNREDELLLRQRLPILARVPRMPQRVIRGYLRGEEPLPGDVREAYRTLRASLATATREGFPPTILVTSAIPGEGKTMTSVNLAHALASTGARVILVDADLRRPMIATIFGVAATRTGFANVLAGQTSVADAIVPAPGGRGELQLLLATPEHAHLVDLLHPGRFAEVLAELKLHADVVVIDSAPLTEVADALNIAAEVDAILVAVRLGRSRRDKLNELRRVLSRRGVSPLGFIVTTSKRSRGSTYYATAGADASPPPSPPLLGEERAEPALAARQGDRDSF